MDAFHAAVAGGRWGYCPREHCRPRGAARVQARRRGRARLRVDTRAAVAEAEADAAPEPEPTPWTAVPPWSFRCRCGDPACTGVA